MVQRQEEMLVLYKFFLSFQGLPRREFGVRQIR